MIDETVQTRRENIVPSIERLDAPENLTALAYNSIKAYILREELDEDHKLTEENLSRQLGISKSPVREALNSLRMEGLVRIEARRGAYLRRFSAKEVKDLYDLREALEIYAIGVVELTSGLISDLRRSTKRTRQLLKAGDRLGHIEEDANFHGLIADATGNAQLALVLTNIQNQIWICRRKTYDLSSSTTTDAHLAILEALENGDREKAQAAMGNHISLVRQRLIAFMESTT